jgi:hypothetical protein
VSRLFRGKIKKDYYILNNPIVDVVVAVKIS